MLEAKTAHDVAAKILPSDPDWYEAMEVDASQIRAHDPEQPLPLDYFEHGDDEEGE